MEFAFTLAFLVYLAPWIVSEWRQRDDSGAILTLNLVTGWTLIGWLGALWWAGRDALPARAPRRAPLELVRPHPPEDARRAGGGRRGVALAASALALAGLAAAGAWATREAPEMETGRVAVADLALRAAPDATAAVVGRLPRGCVTVVTERRGDWRRLWRTAACAGAPQGRASGWVRGEVTR